MPWRVPTGAVEVLRSLPRPHIKHLFNVYRSDIRPSWNTTRRFEKLAELLGPNGTIPYQHLYLDFNVSHFAWYLYDDTLEEIPAIYNRLRRRNKIMSGIYPTLKEDDKLPKLHRMIDQGTHLIFEFGAMDAYRNVMRNWTQERIPVDHIYRAVVRDNPFTVEVRAPGGDKQIKVLESLAASLELDLDQHTPCHLTSVKKRNSLEKRLAARFTESDLRCGTDGLRSLKMQAEAGKTLHESEEYRVQMEDRDARDETRRGYEFDTLHPDRYPETSLYSVALENGDLRMSPRSSERAIELLRQHVVAIFST